MEGPLDDNALMLRARAGDDQAFDLLVARHTARLYRLARRMSQDRAEAEEIVQETWVRAWQALDRYRANRPLFPWLARIAVNLARDAWRRHQPETFSDLAAEVEALPAEDAAPEAAALASANLERLAEGVARLRPEYRAVIALRYEGGLTYAEIAQALGVPLNTVRTHLRRAKAELRRWMEQEDERSPG